MTPYAGLLIIGLTVLVQSSVMPAASLGATKPLLPLLVVVSWGLLRGPMAGAWWALAAGLMMDVLSPSPMLFYTLPMLAVAGIVALGRGRLFPSNLLMPWLVVCAATAAFVLAQRALLPLVGGLVTWRPEAVAREVLLELALNALWLPVVYVPLRSLERRVRRPRIEWEN